MKIVLLFVGIFLFGNLLGKGNAALDVDIKKNKAKNVVEFNIKDTLIFSEWIQEKLFNRRLSYPMDNRYVYEFIYLNSVKQVICADVKLEFKKTGKLKDCQIEGIEDLALKNEIKRIIMISPKWKTGGRQSLCFKIRLPLDGAIVSLERGARSFFDGERMGFYVNNVGIAMSQFGARKRENEEGRFSEIKYCGILKFSFVVNKEGHFSNFKCLKEPFPKIFDRFYREHSSSGGLFHEGQHWEPAVLEGKPINVKVIAEFDFDKQEYGWDYYLVER